MVYNAAQAMLAVIRHTTSTKLDDTLEYVADQLDAFLPVGSAPNNEDIDEYIKNKRQVTKRKAEDWGEESSWKRRQLRRSVEEDEMDVNTDMPVCDRSASRVSLPEVVVETEWPAGLRMTDSPLSDIEGVASPSGLSAKEKEKEKTPEMEIEDVAGPSGNLAANTALATVPVKVEEVDNPNREVYEIVEVAANEPAVEEAAVEGAEAEVEPKPEPVEPVIPPVIVEWTKKNQKKLRITTRKIADKDVIEILNSEDELLVEEGSDDKEEDEEGEDEKKPDTQNGDGNAPES
jgi:hypothetical protein